MKTIAFLTTSAALLLAACASLASPAPAPEAELAKAIDGRVAGEPVSCINLREIGSTRIIEGTAILYTMRNGTVYVNRPTSGASALRRTDILVSDTHSGQLCSIDIVRLQDSTMQTMTGSVGLAKFIPYPRTKRSAS